MRLYSKGTGITNNWLYGPAEGGGWGPRGVWPDDAEDVLGGLASRPKQQPPPPRKERRRTEAGGEDAGDTEVVGGGSDGDVDGDMASSSLASEQVSDS